MNLYDRVIENLKVRRQKVLRGEINCIPSPFLRFRSEFPGVEQGCYYLISAGTKAGKTQLANYLFVYNTIMYAIDHKDIIKPKIFYYNFEENQEEITLRFMSYLLFTLDGIRISPTDLKSTDKDKPVSIEILKLLNSDKYKRILDYYEEIVTFHNSDNPTGIYRTIMNYAKNNGIIHKKPYKYRDELGEEQEGQKFDYYTPNNPNEYVMIIIDHISICNIERGFSLRETINKLSEYLIMFRNRYNYIPVVLQQQSQETLNLEAFKSNKIRPTMSGLADSKGTGKDCTIMMGITSPFSHDIKEYLGYDISKLKSHFRCLEIVLNRKGQSNGICPLYIDGAINYFSELPRPDNQKELEKIYNYINNIEKRVKPTLIHFLIKLIKTKNYDSTTNREE
jgi:hypothetical protein